jgi:predicted lipoprotein with Yx(FWY)xxD motif
MRRPLTSFRARPRPFAAMLVAAIAAVAMLALAGIALAKTFTLAVAKNAKVTDTAGTSRTENIVKSRGFAVYTLTGDSKRHPECTRAKGCFGIWPPVTASSARKLSKGPGVRGKLTIWRHDGVSQVLLGRHPVYMYAGDTSKASATGEGIRSFGGTWHVVKTSSGGSSNTSSSSPSMSAPPPASPYPTGPGY